MEELSCKLPKAAGQVLIGFFMIFRKEWILLKSKGEMRTWVYLMLNLWSNDYKL